MPRPRLLLLLPALLLAACGQLPSAVPNVAAPGATAPGTPDQQALPGVFRIDFDGVGTDTPTSRVQSLLPGGLSAQGLVSTPDQFTLSQIAIQTFTSAATGIRHVRVTYEVKNTSSRDLRNPKFVAVVPQGSTTDSVFSNVRYFDGSDASAATGKLTLVQGQTFESSTDTVVTDPLANPVLTGLDVSGVDITGKGIKTLTQTGWGLTPPTGPGNANFLPAGASTFVTFGVNVPMTPAADGGARKDPFSFSLNVTAVVDAQPLAAMTSAVKQWDALTKTFANYVNFPTQTYTQDGATITRSLPAYYDVSALDGSTTPKVLCGGDANMSVTRLTTDMANFPNRWRVQLWSLGDHTLNVYDGTSCPATGTPKLSQTVTGVGTSGSSIAAGTFHSLALKTDGTVQSWGRNNYGQLGNGTKTNQNLPGPVNDLSGIASLSAGSNNSLALKADGTVWSWGQNDYGQLGITSNSTSNSRSTPGLVGGLSDVVGISASETSLALKADGTVWSWGRNTEGQLGDGTVDRTNTFPTQRPTPVLVKNLNGVVSVMSSYHSLALKADGTVWGWGYNGTGAVGNGTTTNQSTPALAVGLSGVASIAAGTFHSVALKADGTVWSWGRNLWGELGDDTEGSRKTPGPVNGLSNVVRLEAKAYDSLVLQADGTVQGWGRNLGKPHPLGNLGGTVGLAVGETHRMVLKADGTVQSWGSNLYGQLGDGTNVNGDPVTVKNLSGVAQPMP